MTQAEKVEMVARLLREYTNLTDMDSVQIAHMIIMLLDRANEC